MVSLSDKRKNDWQISASHFNVFSYALSTLLDLRQEAQTYNDFGVPLTLHLTFLMFDFHILLDLL